jgi:hypothetical protein
VPRAKIEHAFDLKRQLKNIDKIFRRVFAEKAGADQVSAFKKKSLEKKVAHGKT